MRTFRSLVDPQPHRKLKATEVVKGQYLNLEDGKKTMTLQVTEIEPRQMTFSGTFKKIEVILARDGDALRDEQGREVEAWGRPEN